MFKKLFLVGGIIGVVIIGFVLYLYLKPTAAATAPIEAIPLATETSTEVIEPSPENSPIPMNTQSPTEAPTEIVISSKVFEIDPSRSKARFVIDEVLNGSPKTVIGETDQVSGQISIDVNTPFNSRIGVIQVNTRTISTDNEFRNRAIKNRILLTDQYEYATFTPVEISGLPEQVTVGQTFTFQVVGDLTVRNVTKRVTFNTEVTATSESEIQGKATVTILYADFGIVIPSVPQVTGVSDEVLLEIEFTAATV